MDNIYFDFAATTPLDPSVFERMKPFFLTDFGNPSSIHLYGQKAETAIENSRKTIARLLGAKPNEIIFTGSGSEGDNLALRGAGFLRRKEKNANKILISPVEHQAINKTALQLKNDFGFNLEYLRVDNFGIIDLNYLQEKIDDKVALVSIINANNEIGSINPIREISKLCREKGVLFHSDAVQACAHFEIDFESEGCDLLTLAAHKFYGPKGIGALICRDGVGLVPQITGGKQENGSRAGTENVPGIIGLAAALEIKTLECQQQMHRLTILRDKLIDKILNEISGAHLTGHPKLRLPNHASFIFEGINGNDLVIMLDMAGFSCSSGSACKVGEPKPSSVLLSIGIEPEKAIGSLRVTLGKYSTESEVDAFLDALPNMIKKLRKK